MKKKILFVLVLFLGLSSISLGQNFEPGEQAKGMSNMKNVSVDYSTGIFSYTVSLFELSSARYRLPVSLVYSANGVKVEDKMGQLGFGWTLACGGVISRVVRGGIADDASEGFLNNTLSQTADVRERVNNREQDGESDIYTAVFNGRNISFISVREEGKIVIKPLEKTNLLIENIAGGFRITDESGIKYVFTSKEMSVGVCFQNSNSSANNIWNSSFCSSWYLTDIFIPGDEPVHFEYTDETIVNYTYLNETVYNYGKALRVREFDLDYYKREIDKNLDDALYFAKSLAIQQQFASLAADVNRVPQYVDVMKQTTYMSSYGFPVTILESGGQIRVPDIGMTIDYGTIARSFLLDRVVGYLSDVSFVTNSLSNTMTQIDQLVVILENTNFPASCAPQAVALKGCLREVLRYLRLSIERVTQKNIHHLKDFSQQSIKEVGLKRVSWGKDRIVIKREGRLITSIQWQNFKKDVIRKVDLSYNRGCLQRLTIGYDNSELSGYYNFSYHLDTLRVRSRDIWGYCNGAGKVIHFIPLDQMVLQKHSFVQVGNIRLPSGMETFYDGSANEEYAKAFSLKRISGTGKWSLDVDYELNEYDGEKFGGIRVKEIMLNDGCGNVDTVRYHYRDLSATGEGGSGVLICGYQTLARNLDYGSFQDKIYFSRVQDDEMAIVKRGNNGILYQYVLEEQVGNGYVAYYNLVPASFRMNTTQRAFFPYWLHGLPLGTAVYDSRGRLVRLQKTRYSRDLTQGFSSAYGISTAVNNEFFTGESVFPFSSRVDQIKPYAYAMNVEEVRGHFPDEEKPLYWNGAGVVNYNPYNDYYVPNVKPRENMIIPNQYYMIYYGGCVVPVEEVEYEFFDQQEQANGTPSIADFTRTSFPLKYNMTTRGYIYGNLDRVTPTSVLTRCQDGTEYREDNKVVMDVFPGNNGYLLDSMRGAHMCYLPVRTTNFVKPTGSSTFLLAGENVVTYMDTLIDNSRYYFPFASWKMLLTQPESVNANNQYFTLDQSRYSKIQQLRYAKFGNRILVQECRSREKNEITLYDDRSGLPLFTANAVDPAGIAAFNNCIPHELRYENFSNLPNANRIAAFKDFYKFHTGTSSAGVSRDSFLRSKSHQEILAVAKAILEDKVHRQNCLEEIGKLDKVLYEYEMAWYRNKDYWGVSCDDYLSMVEDALQIIRLDGREPGIMSYAWYRDENVTSKLIVRKATGNKYRYKLLVQKSTRVKPVTVSWKFSRGETSVSSGQQQFDIPVGNGFYCLEGDIPVAGSEHSASLEVYTDKSFLGGCLFPGNITCMLYCYDSKGQVVCRVGSNGIIDSREYDNNGRLSRVFDKNGNILEEYNYHVNSDI